jgi:hypothetical protein
MRTMYLPYVTERFGVGGIPAARTVKTTLAEAKALLDLEVRNAGKTPLDWRDEFGGATAVKGVLVYDVVPVQVDAPEPDDDFLRAAREPGDRMRILRGYALTYTNRESTVLVRETDGEWVREWRIHEDAPTLADLAQAAFADHLAIRGH